MHLWQITYCRLFELVGCIQFIKSSPIISLIPCFSSVDIHLIVVLQYYYLQLLYVCHLIYFVYKCTFILNAVPPHSTGIHLILISNWIHCNKYVNVSLVIFYVCITLPSGKKGSSDQVLSLQQQSQSKSTNCK